MSACLCVNTESSVKLKVFWIWSDDAQSASPQADGWVVPGMEPQKAPVKETSGHAPRNGGACECCGEPG